MHNITLVNKANFLKVYNNFVLKWLIRALCVVVVPEQILESLSSTSNTNTDTDVFTSVLILVPGILKR